MAHAHTHTRAKKKRINCKTKPATNPNAPSNRKSINYSMQRLAMVTVRSASVCTKNSKIERKIHVWRRADWPPDWPGHSKRASLRIRSMWTKYLCNMPTPVVGASAKRKYFRIRWTFTIGSAHFCAACLATAHRQRAGYTILYFPIDCRCKFDFVFSFSRNIIHCFFGCRRLSDFVNKTSLTLMAIYLFRVISLWLFLTCGRPTTKDRQLFEYAKNGEPQSLPKCCVKSIDPSIFCVFSFFLLLLVFF